jgi:hypothetical protein
MYQALAIAYHALAGHTVCPADDPDRVAECHGDPRRHVPLHAHRPELNPRICGLVEEGGLLPPPAEPLNTSNASRTLLRDEPLFDTQDPAILEARAAAATESRERAETTTRRRTFLRHHGKTIAITALIIAAVLTVPVSILRGALRPPATEGMDARTVAETYYRAWNDLDHVLLEDTLARGVGRDTLREVTNVFVIDRVQTAQSWRSMLIEADEWLEAGRPGGRMPTASPISRWSLRASERMRRSFARSTPSGVRPAENVPMERRRQRRYAPMRSIGSPSPERPGRGRSRRSKDDPRCRGSDHPRGPRRSAGGGSSR